MYGHETSRGAISGGTAAALSAGTAPQGYSAGAHDSNKAKPEMHTRVEHLQHVVNELEMTVSALSARLGPVLRQHAAEPAQPPNPPRAVPSTPLGTELDMLFSRLYDVNCRAQALLEDLEV